MRRTGSRHTFTGLVVVAVVTLAVAGAQEPVLPTGLGAAPKSASPAAVQPDQPALPPGFDTPANNQDSTDDLVPPNPWARLRDAGISGFWDTRLGTRLQPDRVMDDDLIIAETRLQLKLDRVIGPLTLALGGDLLYDLLDGDDDIDLESGRGWIDLRSASIGFTPASFADVKIGRQILTWGTGDLVFINDCFPKDWQAFFVGRDEEYLKAPSDALKVSLYGGRLPNLDIVYTPRFDADRHVDGTRLSFWNQGLQRRSGNDAPISTAKPDDWFEADEWALRMFKTVKGYECALYYYRGYWKSPAGGDPLTGDSLFPELSVYGGSIRGPLGPGIAHLEVGYYDSRADRSGSNPNVANSECRFLVGYERELAPNLTGGIQYYVEHMLDHDGYLAGLKSGTAEADATRHSVTVRLTQLLMQQNLTCSVFARYSPTDNDLYLRPKIHYKINDNWSAELGGNIFAGHDHHTFLNQFARNSSVYGGVRCAF